jgi:hypothetical protein
MIDSIVLMIGLCLIIAPFRTIAHARWTRTVAPSYSRRLHKYSGRGFAVAVPGLNRDFVEDSLRFVASLREHGKKISGTNGLLWLLSRERVNPYLKKKVPTPC